MSRKILLIPIVVLIFSFNTHIQAQTVLYEQLPFVTNTGAGAGGADVSVAPNPDGLAGVAHQFAAGNSVAEDFEVPAGGWFINKFLFYAYQTGASTSPSTITGVYWQIWDGDPQDASSSVIFGNLTDNTLLTSTWSNVYRVFPTPFGNLTDSNRPVMRNEANVGLSLPEGTYWVQWSTDGSLGSGPWAPVVSTDNMNTGNALQLLGTNWQAVDNGGFTQALIFAIDGNTSPVDFDAAVTDVNFETCSNKFTKVTVTVQNRGVQPISNFPVGFVFDGGDPVVETFSNTVLPLESAEYTFVQTIDISDGMTHVVDTYASLPGDPNAINDAIVGRTVVSTGSSGGFVSFPFTEDFEGGIGDCSDIGWLPTGWRVSEDNVDITLPVAGQTFIYGEAGTTCVDDGGWFTPDARPGSPNFMSMNDDLLGSFVQSPEERLILPSMNLVLNQDLEMTYAVHMDGQFGETAHVEASLDGGTTWQNVEDIQPTAAGGFGGPGTWGTYTTDLSAYDGLSDVTFAFRYNDNGGFANGFGVDDVTITATTLTGADASMSTPLVEEQYVPQGTPHHVIYQAELNTQDGFFLLNDVVFKTNGSYRPSDISAQGDTLGFRLWWSADSILGPGDPQLGRVAPVTSGSLLPFVCLNNPLTEQAETLYIFLTADIAPDAVDERTIWVEALTNDDVFATIGNITVQNATASERQIIGSPPQVLGNIFMADLFTPNGDNKNDTYTILGGAIDKEEFSFKIFDRNGKIVYETTVLEEAINEGWDGQVEGEDAPNGVYLWSLEGRYLNGQPLTYNDKKTGTIRLLR